MTGETSEITDGIPAEDTRYPCRYYEFEASSRTFRQKHQHMNYGSGSVRITGQDYISAFGPPCSYIRR